MTKSRQIGTKGETGVTRYLATHGFPLAERRRLRGRSDGGDIIAHPGLVFEIKAGQAAKSASLLQLSLWMAETERERANMGADFGILVVQRQGYASSRAGHWRAYLRLEHLLGLAAPDTACRYPASLAASVWEGELSQLVHLLREAGYGDPLLVGGEHA
jgi:hypothetical protein